MNRKRVAVVVLAVLFLSGCGDPAGPPIDGSPSESPGASPSESPSESPDPAVSGDFGFTFFESVQLGATFAEASAQSGSAVTAFEGCPYYAPLTETPEWVTTALTDFEAPGSGISFFYTNLFDPEASASALPRNAEGVGVGSTEAEVLAAYPTAVAGNMNDLGAGNIHTVTVVDPVSLSRYVFGFTEGSPVVDLLQWGGPKSGNQWSHLCGGF